jgi:serine/threonine protein kinase
VAIFQQESKGIVNDPRVGTPLYLAPELVKHQPYDYKIDIWAVGCTMYYLTALSPPFGGENLSKLASNITSATPSELPKYYTDRYKNFIYSLLAK